MNADEPETPRRVLERIKKLLALADSSNPHEAANAAALAAGLMAKHRLEAADLGDLEDDFGHTDLDESGAANWRWVLGHNVALVHGCTVVRGKRGRKKVLIVVGSPLERDATNATHKWLLQQMDRFAVQARAEAHLALGGTGPREGWTGAGQVLGSIFGRPKPTVDEYEEGGPRIRAYMKDWRTGFVFTVKERLIEAAQEHRENATGTAIARIDEQADRLLKHAQGMFGAPVVEVTHEVGVDGFAHGSRDGRRAQLRDEKKLKPGQRGPLEDL